MTPMIDGSPTLLRKALIFSAIGHVVIVGLGMFGLSWQRRLPEDPPITVEIVAVDQAFPVQQPAPEAAAAAPLPKLEAASPRPGPENKPIQQRAQVRPPEPAPVQPEPPAKPQAPPPRPSQPEPTPPPAPPPEPRPAEPEAPPPPPAPPPSSKPTERPTPSKETTVAEKPEPVKEEPKPKVAERPKPPPPPKEEVKQANPVAKATEPTEEKQEEDSLASLLKSVEQIEKRVQSNERRQGRGTAETAAPSMAEINALLASAQRQMESCWKLIGVTGAEQLGTFDVNVHFRPSGEAESVQLVETPQLSSDPLFRSVAESAVRAAWSCKLSLPSEQYGIWRNIVFEFDPRRALTG
jgi:hypothetical protein